MHDVAEAREEEMELLALAHEVERLQAQLAAERQRHLPSAAQPHELGDLDQVAISRPRQH